MDLTNDAYVIQIRTKSATERYYRDKIGWVKVSTRGRTFRATAEQVLNHVLPVLAGIKPRVTVEVTHCDPVGRGGGTPGPIEAQIDSIVFFTQERGFHLG